MSIEDTIARNTEFERWMPVDGPAPSYAPPPDHGRIMIGGSLVAFHDLSIADLYQFGWEFAEKWGGVYSYDGPSSWFEDAIAFGAESCVQQKKRTGWLGGLIEWTHPNADGTFRTFKITPGSMFS